MKNFSFLKDIEDFLTLLFKHQVKYLIVGGEAVIYYGYARLTGDIGIFMKIQKKIAKSYLMLYMSSGREKFQV